MGAPAVECSEPEHELSQFERLGEVVVGTELEPGGLVVKPVGSRQHEDRHAAAASDDAFGNLVTRRPGDIAVKDGNVVRVNAQQLQSRVAVTRDVGRNRLQTQPIADGLCHVGLVLNDQHTQVRMLPRRHISLAYGNPDTC